MNISYNWLKDYLDLSLTPEEVSSALTSIGLETGGIEEVQAKKALQSRNRKYAESKATV